MRDESGMTIGRNTAASRPLVEISRVRSVQIYHQSTSQGHVRLGFLQSQVPHNKIAVISAPPAFLLAGGMV